MQHLQHRTSGRRSALSHSAHQALQSRLHLSSPLSKWPTANPPHTGGSACTSAKRNGAHSSGHSESVRLRYFLIGAAFMQAVNVLLNLWLDAA